jgi:Leucine-rich repeat (LRR) protein
LSFPNNHIAYLDENIFENLTKLEKIDLSNNDLTRLDKGVFQVLLNLLSLDLSNNRLTEFTPTLNSKNMKQLKLAGNIGITNATISSGRKSYVCDLDFSYTGIAQLHASAFANLVCEGGDQKPKMNISFSGNFLKTVDTNTFDGMGNVSIGRLDMSDARWEFILIHSALSDFFRALYGRSIDYLDLSGCSLTEENVKDFPLLNNTAFLGTLDVSRNMFGPTIKTWPIYVYEIASVHTMLCLNISSNNIGKGLIFNQMIPNLTELDLTNNQIIIYEDSVIFSQSGRVNVPSLRVLRMTGAFGDTWLKPGVWTNLTWFWELETLEELYLDDNYKLFDASDKYHFSVIFRGLVNLRNLSLSDTGFGRRRFRQEELENFLIDQRKSLLNLKMRNNYMSHRQLVILKGLERLEVLDLRSNRIGYLDKNWFNLNLRELDVSDNSLLTISCTATLSQALESTLERMWIGDNAYDCTCPLADFVDWLNDHAVDRKDAEFGLKRKVEVPDLNLAQCMGPVELNGLPILKYQPNWLICEQRGLIVVGAVGAFLFLVLVIAAIVIYYCRVNIHFCLKTSRRGYRIVPSGEVFMGYCDGHLYENFNRNREDKWVNDNINTNLEICVDLPVYITFMEPVTVNKSLGEQIVEKHQDYRFMLLIVGPLFVDHLWEGIKINVCEKEEVMKQCRKKFVLVLLGLKQKDLPPGMKALWEYGACYTYTRARQDQFWKKLKLKLAEKQGIC